MNNYNILQYNCIPLGLRPSYNFPISNLAYYDLIKLVMKGSPHYFILALLFLLTKYFVGVLVRLIQLCVNRKFENFEKVLDTTRLTLMKVLQTVPSLSKNI